MFYFLRGSLVILMDKGKQCLRRFAHLEEVGVTRFHSNVMLKTLHCSSSENKNIIM